MRVLHLDLGREMRGGQWQALRLVRGLRQQGHDAVMMARCAELIERGATPFSVARLIGRHRNFDLIHAHDARSHMLAAPLAVPPLIVSRRVAFPVSRTALSRWKYSRAAHFIAVSDFVGGRLMEAGVAAEQISVVPDGVDLAASVEPCGHPPRVVAVETADAMKGRDLAREAAARAGVSIQFTRDLERDLPGASVLVYLTREEGLGSAALMALAAGVPVIASRVGGLPEAVEDGVCGLLVENDAEAVSRAIRRLLDAPGEARRMGLAGRERIAARFTTGIMVEKTLEVYRKVLS